MWNTIFQHFKHGRCIYFVLFNVRVKYSKNKWNPRRSGVLDLHQPVGVMACSKQERSGDANQSFINTQTPPIQSWVSLVTPIQSNNEVHIELFGLKYMFGEQRTPGQLFSVGVNLSWLQPMATFHRQRKTKTSGRKHKDHL